VTSGEKTSPIGAALPFPLWTEWGGIAAAVVTAKQAHFSAALTVH
jgi:hypothetical protein